MGKKSRVNNKSVVAKVVEVDEAVSNEVAELKKKGNNLFAEREYLKALELYETAAKKLPDGSQEKADIYSNRAACYIQMKKYKEATKECSVALETCPGFTKALLRRARAYEAQSLFKQALSDIQQINRSSSANDESKETERRLKDIVAGRKSPAISRVATANRPPHILYFIAKCTFENESRLIHISHSTSYAELLEVVHLKFPNAIPCVIKFCDKEGDLVTISERSDLSLAISEVLQAYERQLGGGGGPRLPPQLPPIRLVLTKVDDPRKVPVPPQEEIFERNQFLATQKAYAQGRNAKTGDKRVEVNEEGVYEIDDWLIDFANLFRDRTGIDPDRHVDMHNLGVEKCQRALESTIHSQEALPIFDEAAEKFREVTCVGLLNWGNVYLCVGHKIGSEAALQGKNAEEVEDKILEYFDKAEDRYNLAMDFKNDFYDGILALAQLEFERAKIKIGLIIEPPMDPDTEKEPAEKPKKAVSSKDAEKDEEKAQQEALTAMNEAMKKALTRVKKEKFAEVQELIEKSWKMYAKGVELGQELDKQREEEKEKKKAALKQKSEKSASAEGNGEAAAIVKEKEKEEEEVAAKEVEKSKDETEMQNEDLGLRTHALVMWGNVIFEQSQILAVTDGDWKKALDDAISKFKEAGCNQKDINQALVTHIKASELDIPVIEPEKVEKPDTPVKGLPPLDSRPSKKSVEAT